MAYNKILIKRRNTAGGTPTINYGELAWNQADETLYIGTDAVGGGSKVLAGEGSFVALNPAGADQTLAQSLTIGASPTAGSGISHYLYFKQQGESAAGTRIYQTGGDLTVGTHNGSTWTDRFKVKDGTGLVWANNGFETGNIQISDDADGGKLVATGTNGGIKLVTTLAGQVIIDADSAGAGVQIDAGSAGVDINSAGTVSIDATGASKAVNITSNNDKVLITGKGASTGAVKLNAFTTDASTTLEITSAGTGTSAVDINSAGGVDIDATSAVTVDANSVTLTGSNNGASAVELSATGGANSTVKISSVGTGATAIDIDSTGGVNIDAAKDIDLSATERVVLTGQKSTADAVTIEATGTNGGITLDAKAGNITTTVVDGKSITTSNHNSATAVQFNATGANGGIAFDSKLGGLNLNSAAGTIALTSTLGQVAITSTEAVAEAVKIAATGVGAATQVEITSVGTNDTNTIGASAIYIAASGGGIALDAAKDINLDAVANITLKSTSNLANAVYVHADGGTNETIKVHSDQGTGAGSIQLTSDSGGVDINAGTTIAIDAVGAANLTSSGADVTVEATAKSVVITGAEAVADAVQVTASNAAGGVDINAGTGGITVDTTGSLSLDAVTNSNFTTSTGNISIDGKTGINLKADGTNAVTIGSDGDVAFTATGGTNSNPDLGVSGYARFTDALEVDNIKINGNTITSIDTDGNINLTPDGTGSVVISKVDIDSGTIDDVTITGGSLTSKVISKGTLDIRIAGASGTVTTAADKQTVTSSAVHGVSVGDAVKLPSGAAGADEVFTVATVTSSTIFVLDTVSTTQLTSASVAYKDDNLFVVQNGDAVNRLVVDPTGNLTIEGDLVVNGTTTTVNSTVVTVDDAIIQLGDLDATPAAGNVTADMGISWARVSGTGPYTRDYGFMGWDESKDEVSIKSDLTSTPAGNIGGSYAPINVEHVRINGSSINRDAQWQKIYDEIWASAIGDTSGVPDSITSAMQDKFLMVKRNGSVGSYTYDFEMTDTLDGGTW